MNRKLLTIALLLFLAAGAEGWNHTGHKTVGLIAYRELSPEARSKAIQILMHHPKYEDWIKNVPEERREAHAFMMAAVWPDDIRETPEDMPKDHFINLPYVIGGIEIPASHSREAVLAADSVLKHLERSMEALRSEKDPVKKAKELCWLLHLMGDIHQPLHATAMHSPEMREGDLGGNVFIVAEKQVTLKPGAGYLPNLHSYWDGLVGTNQSWGYIVETADRCAKHPRSEFEEDLKKKGRFLDWAEESRDLAIHHAYLDGNLTGLSAKFVKGRLAENRNVYVPVLTKGYQTAAETVAERRIALAGYRLADAIAEALK
jgi:hypothetical protein